MKFKSMKFIVSVILLISISLNGFLFLKLKGQPWHIDFKDANSRETYFTLHNVKEAQSISKGKGIKVGVLDHDFGYENHKELYKEGIDFIGNSDSINKSCDHGYWMSLTLKEIAPECDVYAMNIADSNEDKKVTAMIKAIDWAIEHKIDILTYSQAPISEKNRQRFDEAVNKAIKNNIVTTFIHYDNPNNIWPNGMSASRINNNQRQPDLNILNYDYNVLRIDTYKKYEKSKNNISGGNNIPYFSLSSTSPVIGGFVAILKGINNTLSPSDYKDILKKTSYKTTFKDPFTEKEFECPSVADIEKAVTYLKENYK
ncbi:S8/S53 family peptidase [Clostridium lundense]|uniref:S8/S53 family peptidase n=1 Tax=Clostridium lundense TaxID=319475 RepID=UPI00047FFEF1|nr:S8/S53 family peptidase [Clostridium lundense]